MNLRISVESTGQHAEAASAFLAHFAGQIEGATSYIRPPTRFITEMWPMPDIEARDCPPHFSIFAHVDEHEECLIVSLIALRVNASSKGVTSCVLHDARPVLPVYLQERCKEFVRTLADTQGGIRWLHKYIQLVRDLVE